MSTTTGVLQRAQDVELEGRGVLTLKVSDYVATGGEGSLYRPSRDTIVKIYADSNKMIRDGMAAKIGMLKKIQHNFIVTPLGLVFKNQTPIGFYMKFAEGDAMARVFATSYQTRENFTDSDVLHVVEGMRTVVKTAHTHRAILVDANELNWLVSRTKKIAEPRVIDVDSWAIGSWKASVIMPSIRDWHTNGFNEKSDWFSFGIVSFQVFTGIHPYKGTLRGYQLNDMQSRMKDKKSVFTQGVHLNNAVRDLNLIPGPLRSWYEAVFQGNERGEPPSPFDTTLKTPKAIIVHRAVATASGLLLIDKLFDGGSDVPVRVYSCGVVLLKSGAMVDLTTTRVFDRKFSQSAEVVLSEEGFLIAELSANDMVNFTLVDKKGISTAIDTVMHGKKIVRYYDRMFVIGNDFTEVMVKKFTKFMVVSLNSWQVLTNSTKWFNGVGVQDALGAIYAIVPFGDKAVQYLRVPELDQKRVVDGIAGNRYIAFLVLNTKNGVYQKYELVMNHDHTEYVLTVTDLAVPDINIATLPKGVCATIVEDGKLQITAPASGNQTNVDDGKIDTSFTLFNWGNKVVATQGTKVWSVSMK